MTGADGHTINALPHDALKDLMGQEHKPTAW
jgi:hypothetical protein